MGDQLIMIGPQKYYLRLTLGALAEIAETLPARGPYDLSQQMKGLTPEKILIVLTALLRPIYGHDFPQMKRADIKPNHVKAIAKVFEQSFSILV